MLQSGRFAAHLLNSEGVWCQILRQPPRCLPALFLDRDGVVIQETGYLCRVDDIVVLPGATEVISAANDRGIPVIMATNQAGIGRAYYSWTEFKTVQDSLLATLAVMAPKLMRSMRVLIIQADGSLAHPDHPARKPNPGMLLQAACDLALNLKSSWLIGDKTSDIEAAKRAGIAGAFHVATGYGAAEGQGAAKLADQNFEVRFGPSIADAMKLPILMRKVVT